VANCDDGNSSAACVERPALNGLRIAMRAFILSVLPQL